MANALLNKGSTLTVNEVINFFKSYPSSFKQCIDTPPVDVKGGDSGVYIFKTYDTDKQGKVNSVATMLCC